ncbi:MAG: aminotransferase class V-fold PLP-dependent enzyme [Alphaproteobacteria bacterium]|nr:aminotransferase class V-fold PLP-dependent enzyme [Alphaproteobacteria bacterium]
MPIDLHRARAETPGCDHVIHLNNAGAALMPAAVLHAVTAHLHREARLGGYEAAREAADQQAAAYTCAARVLGCAPDEIAFTDSATRAFDTALWALPLGAGDRIAVSRVCYGSNALALLELKRRVGVRVVVLPSVPDGAVDLDALEAALREGLAAVALTHIPTNSGLIQPAAEVGALARAHGVPYLLDACQSFGQLQLDVEALGCDVLTATSRKYMRGPRGQGVLYVRRALLERLHPPMPDLGSARWTDPDTFTWVDGARRLECWEHSVASRLGFAAAMEVALGFGLDAIEARVLELGAQARARLAAVDGVTVQDPGPRRCGIVTFTKRGVAPAHLQAALAERRIHTSVADAPGALLDMRARGLDAVVRASVHYYNTLDELDQLAEAVAQIP